jgi:hypothetical protein
MACNCGKRRMAQVTSANVDASSPTHAEAAAKIAAAEALVAAATEVTVPDDSGVATRAGRRR